MNTRLTRGELAPVAIGSIAFAIVFGFPVLLHLSQGDVPNFLYYNDWDAHLQFHWVPFHSIVDFHQFPQWDPFTCGGMPILANPESALLSPFMILDLLFGPVVGLRLTVVNQIAIAFGGAYCLARVMRVSKLGAIVCAGAFAGSSWYYLHVEVGHTSFIPFAYTPWVVAMLCLGADYRQFSFAALGGLAMALMLVEGGLYPFVETGLMVGILALLISIQRHTVLPIMLLAAMGAFTAAFGAVKFLAVSGLTGTYKAAPLIEANGALPLLVELFSRDQNPARTIVGMRMEGGFWEYGAYFGPLIAGLAVIGVAAQLRRAWPWIIIALAMLALAAGNFGPYSPWILIHRLPVYWVTNAPARWLIPFTLSGGLLAGLGADAVCAAAKRWGTIVVAFLIVLTFIDMWLVGARNLGYVVEGQEPPLPISASFRQMHSHDFNHRMLAAARANLGVIDCYADVIPDTRVQGYDQPGYRGEQYLLGPGTVSIARWTPNQLDFDVDASAPTVLVVNQNYDSGWRITEGDGNVIAEDGLLAVRLPAGNQRIRIAFRDWHVLVGFSIATLAAVAMLILMRREIRRGCG
ncbi:MAG TPA: hypothetical protein VMU16_01490 [Candidatus Binataceae bacterium]|nr:hypothetical protein [Candidatus Binataceae bacterium]